MTTRHLRTSAAVAPRAVADPAATPSPFAATPWVPPAPANAGGTHPAATPEDSRRPAAVAFTDAAARDASPAAVSDGANAGKRWPTTEMHNPSPGAGGPGTAGPHVSTFSGSACHRPGPLLDRTWCGRLVDDLHQPGDACTPCSRCYTATTECPTCGGRIPAGVGRHRERVMSRHGVRPGKRWCGGGGDR